MLALAIVLLVIVALLVVVSFVGNSEELVIEFLNVTITTSVGEVFVAGVVSGLIALASALALRRSWRLNRARTEEVRELRRLAGVPEPTESAGAERKPSTTAASTTGGRDSAVGTSATAGERATEGADNAPANLTATDGSHDTAPIPGPEEPPRT